MPLGILQRYILRNLFPYFLFSLSFLTLILAVQQINKFIEVLPESLNFLSLIPLVAQVIFPKILMFTIPMSTFIGVLLGLNKLKSESELRIIQGIGAGPFIIVLPLLLIGSFMAAVCVYNNLYLAPYTQKLSGEYARNANLQQVFSPIIVGTFNSQIPNLTLYVRQGDSLKGEWTGIFLVKKESNGERVITAATGRLDVEGEKVELVLNDVYSLSYPSQVQAATQPLVAERFKTFRLEVEQGKVQEQTEKAKDKINFDELGTDELLELSAKGKEHSKEAMVQLHRRLALALSPIFLIIAGFMVVWSSSETSKGMGLAIALMLLISYYLLFLFGEQLAMSGFLPAYMGAWIANISIILFVLAVVYIKRRAGQSVNSLTYNNISQERANILPVERKTHASYKTDSQTKAGEAMHKATSFPMLLDLNIFLRLSLFFLISYTAFVSLFFVFTVFELWKSIFANKIQLALVAKYFLYLLPYISVQVFAPSMMIASLALLLIMVNRSEIPIWLSTGVSIYRVLVPLFFFSFCVVCATWFIQDYFMPKANLIQDSLRFQIKTGFPKSINSYGRQWIAFKERIFNYEFNSEREVLVTPFLYQLDQQGQIERILLGSEGKWVNRELAFTGGIAVNARPAARVSNYQEEFISGTLGPGYFSPTLNKPLYLNANQLKEQIKVASARGEDVASLKLALQKKYADPLIPFVLAVLGACIGLLFSRGKPLRQILMAIFFGIAVIAVTQLLDNVGLSYRLPTNLIAWSPIVIFGSTALYLLALLKT